MEESRWTNEVGTRRWVHCDPALASRMSLDSSRGYGSRTRLAALGVMLCLAVLGALAWYGFNKVSKGHPMVESREFMDRAIAEIENVRASTGTYPDEISSIIEGLGEPPAYVREGQWHYDTGGGEYRIFVFVESDKSKASSYCMYSSKTGAWKWQDAP